MQQTENDILKRVRKIEIKTRGLSNEIFAGKYHTAFRGRGMSFSEVREYRAGDDVRDIDWNVTARSRKPHIKIYEEERELTMMLLVDVSASRMFGTTERLKKNIITEIAAVLAFSAAQNNDKVGCIFFSDKVEKFIPPKKGRSHILMIIRELVGFRPESAGTKLSEPVRFLTNVNKKRCTTFILSDFMDSSKDRAALDDALKIAGGKHDLVGIRVYDPHRPDVRGRGRKHHLGRDHHRHPQQRNRTLTMQQTENDILKRVRKIEIKTRGLSNEIFAGKYHTAFRGRGMSFSEVREYRAGDDVRDIDWNVTARSRKPHIKIYEEERELTMMLLVDVSASRMFGTTERLKKNIITEIAAVLAFSAAQNNDKVGCIFFSDKVEKFIPPKKGRSHILMIIRELVGFRPESAGTKLSEPVRFLTNVNKKRCTTFILSDFMDSSKDRAALDDALKIAGGKHDLVGIRVYDPRETELPDVGIVEMKDAESGRKVWVDTSSRAVREHYAEKWRQRSAQIESTLKHNRIDTAMVSTEGDYVSELIKLFKQR